MLGGPVETSHLSVCELLQAIRTRLREYERSRMSILFMISFTSTFVSFASAFVSFTSAFVSFTSAFVSFTSVFVSFASNQMFRELLCQIEELHTVLENSSIGCHLCDHCEELPLFQFIKHLQGVPDTVDSRQLLNECFWSNLSESGLSEKMGPPLRFFFIPFVAIARIDKTSAIIFASASVN